MAAIDNLAGLLIVGLCLIGIYHWLIVRPEQRRTVRYVTEVLGHARAGSRAAAEARRQAGDARSALAAVEDRMMRLESSKLGRPYEQAIDSASRGQQPDRLVAEFGLTELEARRVATLHGAKAPGRARGSSRIMLTPPK
jgi:hypothetical protein